MSRAPLPDLSPEERDSMTPDDLAGFEAFAEGAALNPAWSHPVKRGWFRAWALCYGQGVKASLVAAAEGREAESPYPQFSGAWEAWAAGHDDEARL